MFDYVSIQLFSANLHLHKKTWMETPEMYKEISKKRFLHLAEVEKLVYR